MENMYDTRHVCIKNEYSLFHHFNTAHVQWYHTSQYEKTNIFIFNTATYHAYSFLESEWPNMTNVIWPRVVMNKLIKYFEG